MKGIINGPLFGRNSVEAALAINLEVIRFILAAENRASSEKKRDRINEIILQSAETLKPCGIFVSTNAITHQIVLSYQCPLGLELRKVSYAMKTFFTDARNKLEEDAANLKIKLQFPRTDLADDLVEHGRLLIEAVSARMIDDDKITTARTVRFSPVLAKALYWIQSQATANIWTDAESLETFWTMHSSQMSSDRVTKDMLLSSFVNMGMVTGQSISDQVTNMMVHQPKINIIGLEMPIKVWITAGFEAIEANVTQFYGVENDTLFDINSDEVYLRSIISEAVQSTMPGCKLDIFINHPLTNNMFIEIKSTFGKKLKTRLRLISPPISISVPVTFGTDTEEGIALQKLALPEIYLF